MDSRVAWGNRYPSIGEYPSIFLNTDMRDMHASHLSIAALDMMVGTTFLTS